jgi:hypothetical protein
MVWRHRTEGARAAKQPAYEAAAMGDEQGPEPLGRPDAERKRRPGREAASLENTADDGRIYSRSVTPPARCLMTGTIIPFPVEFMRDRVIIDLLSPVVRRAIEAHAGADPVAISEATCRLLDPDDVMPALGKEACRAILEQIARDILAGGLR